MTKSLNLYALCIALFISVSCENSYRLGKSDNGYYPMTEERTMYESTEDGYTERDVKPVEPPTDNPKQKLNTEEYDKITENPFQGVAQTPVSTFSIDVDNASYSNMRRYLTGNSLPPSAAVRIEEMINYFDYDYPQPIGKDPFSINTEISSAPWNKEHHLIHIGLQEKELDYDNIKPSNLVFLRVYVK